MKITRVRSVPSIGKDNHVMAAVLAAIGTLLEEENRAAAVLVAIEAFLEEENRARRQEGSARLNRWRKLFRRRGTLINYRWSDPEVARRRPFREYIR